MSGPDFDGDDRTVKLKRRFLRRLKTTRCQASARQSTPADKRAVRRWLQYDPVFEEAYDLLLDGIEAELIAERRAWAMREGEMTRTIDRELSALRPEVWSRKGIDQRAVEALGQDNVADDSFFDAADVTVAGDERI